MMCDQKRSTQNPKMRHGKAESSLRMCSPQEQKRDQMSRTGQEEQIIYALRQAEAGKKVGEICREVGVTSRRRFTVEPRSEP